MMTKKSEFKMYYLINSTNDNPWTKESEDKVKDMLTLRRLAKKHHRIAEMDCNGAGVIRGQAYYIGTIDDYAKREYGYNVKSAYMPNEIGMGDEETIFDLESAKVQAKIQAICDRLGLRVEFQGDPRGYTVKVFKGDRFLDIQG